MTGDKMVFPDTFDEFVDSYGFVDTKEVYTNGSQLIPVFRVKQWLEHVSAKTKMIDKSNFDVEQYRADLQSAFDCGKASVECEDTISRTWIKEAIHNLYHYSRHTPTEEDIQEYIVDDAPSVTPKQKMGRCKDCKWWKDSDGAYRRGANAESQCPINRKEVYEGNGCCFLYEPQEGED